MAFAARPRRKAGRRPVAFLRFSPPVGRMRAFPHGQAKHRPARPARRSVPGKAGPASIFPWGRAARHNPGPFRSGTPPRIASSGGIPPGSSRPWPGPGSLRTAQSAFQRLLCRLRELPVQSRTQRLLRKGVEIQRRAAERMVGSILLGLSVSSRNTAYSGGSSRIFSKAF